MIPILHLGCRRQVSVVMRSVPSSFIVLVTRPSTTSANKPSPPTLTTLQKQQQQETYWVSTKLTAIIMWHLVPSTESRKLTWTGLKYSSQNTHFFDWPTALCKLLYTEPQKKMMTDPLLLSITTSPFTLSFYLLLHWLPVNIMKIVRLENVSSMVSSFRMHYMSGNLRQLEQWRNLLSEYLHSLSLSRNRIDENQQRFRSIET